MILVFTLSHCVFSCRDHPNDSLGKRNRSSDHNAKNFTRCSVCIFFSRQLLAIYRVILRVFSKRSFNQVIAHDTTYTAVVDFCRCFFSFYFLQSTSYFLSIIIWVIFCGPVRHDAFYFSLGDRSRSFSNVSSFEKVLSFHCAVLIARMVFLRPLLQCVSVIVFLINSSQDTFSLSTGHDLGLRSLPRSIGILRVIVAQRSLAWHSFLELVGVFYTPEYHVLLDFFFLTSR